MHAVRGFDAPLLAEIFQEDSDNEPCTYRYIKGLIIKHGVEHSRDATQTAIVRSSGDDEVSRIERL